MNWKRKLKHFLKHVLKWEPSTLDIIILISSILIGLLIVISIDISQHHQTDKGQPPIITVNDINKLKEIYRQQ
jgi:hypothetical protein